MNECVLNLTPECVWKEFHAILAVPRPSKNEGKMVEYLINWAKELKGE